MSSPAERGRESARLLQDEPPGFGSATTYGTFGELLQGYRQPPGGGFEHFLFTLPVVEYRAESTVSLTPGRGEHRVRPSDRTRALAAAVELAKALELVDTQISVTIDSNIPVGKGCASSTADIMASVAALIDATYPEASAAIVHALGTLVGRNLEWGDYVFSDTIALCLQRTHTLVRRYATDLRWRIVGVDEEGSVDTAEFHRRQHESRRLAHLYETLLGQLDTALADNDFTTAAQLATESAVLNQRVLPKRTFGTMRQVAETTGALGIAVAHTGTVIGLIFSGHQSDVALRMWEADQCLRRHGLTSRVFTLREGCGEVPDPAAVAGSPSITAGSAAPAETLRRAGRRLAG